MPRNWPEVNCADVGWLTIDSRVEALAFVTHDETCLAFGHMGHDKNPPVTHLWIVTAFFDQPVEQLIVQFRPDPGQFLLTNFQIAVKHGIQKRLLQRLADADAFQRAAESRARHGLLNLRHQLARISRRSLWSANRQ